MKILVGYDGSKVSQDALKIAQTHAEAFGAELLVVTSLMGGNETAQEAIDQAEAELAQVEAQFKGQGMDCSTHLLIHGMPPGEDIVKFATDHHVEEIVIGVKRRSKVGKLLFGSNAQFIVLNAGCPVVTVR